jgi:hypothetical protein
MEMTRREQNDKARPQKRARWMGMGYGGSREWDVVDVDLGPQLPDPGSSSETRAWRRRRVFHLPIVLIWVDPCE